LNISFDQPVIKHDDFFFFFHIQMLKDLISYIGSCVDCKSKDITLEFVDSNVKGYAAKFSV